MKLLSWVNIDADVANESDRHMRTRGCSSPPFSDCPLTPQAIVALQETAGGGMENLFTPSLGVPSCKQRQGQGTR